MDQRTYMARVDRNLATAREQMLDFLDRSIEMVRQELQQQHAARKPGPISSADPLSFLTALRRVRQSRNDHLPSRLFADPAWDILLELTQARLERREVTVKIVQGAAMVPPSTSIRWLHTLEQEGLVTRRVDPLDHRRTLVALTDTGWESMSKWLDAAVG